MYVAREDVTKALDAIDREGGIAGLMDGEDYDRGSYEALQATCRNLRYTCARLVLLLQAKGVVTTEEICDLFDGNT